MKNLLTHDNVLLKLSKDNKKHSKAIELSDSKLTESSLSKAQAARSLLQSWRKKKVKDAMIKSPFFAYRSMIAPDDKQLELSSMMYGHHVSELLADAKEQINNPLLSTTEYYHRSTPLNNPILNALFAEFNLPIFDQEKYDYIPVSRLANNPIEDVLTLFSASIPNLQLVSKKPYSIAVLIIPKTKSDFEKKLKDKIRNMGLVASSWEIAENIRHTILLLPESSIKISLDTHLPKTQEELLQSDIMTKLKEIAVSEKKYPITLLALCLKKLLSNLPPNISSSAIQRIVTMIEFTNTFYLYHYPRYALCVYSVLHEISLALIENKDPSFLETEYTSFKEESKTTLDNTLHIDKDNLRKSTFLAIASTSGAGACTVTMRIASKMKIPNNKKPKVKIFKPCYYELPNTFNLDNTEDSNAADVLMISAGPIVNPEGLTPGVDINLFIKHHIIDASRTKPVIIIIDATTALYKNIELNTEVQQLIAKGQLSIIIHESHQKFGLIHTDQAQYGRVFGWCSKEHFSEEVLQEVEKNSKDDFFTHSDMRIGAFVNTRCGETLEQIKKRHFTNGALLRKMLIDYSVSDDNPEFKDSIASPHLEKHNDMQKNLDELYFLTDKEISPGALVSMMEYAGYGAIEYRNSFGHYAPTTTDAGGQRRMSPDASDILDNLITANHMRISRHYNYSAQTQLQLIINYAQAKENLSLDEQIVIAGMLHSISSFCPIVPSNFNTIEYLDKSITPMDKKRIISSSNNSKNIIISKSSSPQEKEATFYIGYHSHGTIFRQAKIKDSYIINLIQAGTITQPHNHGLIKKYLSSLQKQNLPENTNFPMIYAAIKNVLECCSSLQNRPSVIDIQNWLSAVKNVIINEYKPENPTVFMQQIRELHSIKELKNDNKMLESLLILLSQTHPIKDKNFITAIKKVYENNQEILEHLKSAPSKYKAAKESSKVYLSACFNALHDFYRNPTPSKAQREHLMISIKNAEKEYVKVLSLDRNATSQCIRYILKATTNFIASLTIGLAHYIYYLQTGTALFFNGTHSENKLRSFHKKLCHGFEKLSPERFNSLTF